LQRIGKVSAAACLALVAGWVGYARPQAVELRFLSVGQGDAILYRSDGVSLLVDAGPRTAGFDSGQRIVVPRLRRLGISRLDMIFLTHPDADHIGGFPTVMRAFPSAQVLISAEFEKHPGLLAILEESGVAPSKVRWLPPLSNLRFGENRLRIVAPKVPVGDIDNEGSLLIRIQRGTASAVLTGDASTSVEERALGLDWRCQVLKAGHHGSGSSTGDAWLRATQPKQVVFSCGRDNPYGHPAAEAVRRAETIGARLWRTDRQGDVVFRVGSTGFEPN